MRPTRRWLLGALGALALPLPGRARAAAPVVAVADLCIAGTGYHGFDGAAARLARGTALRLAREPDNRFDPNAVEIRDAAGVKLGYVPRALAAELAPRLDRGEAVAAEVVRFRGDGSAVDPDAPRFWATDWAKGHPVVRLRAEAPWQVDAHVNL